MLRVLGRASSINVRKVLWTCAELGLPIQHEAGWTGAALGDAAFVALNPNGRIPVIEDDGFVLWESNAICRYLAHRDARLDLLPIAAQDRARVEQWMDWQATDLNDSWRYAFLALVRHSPAHRDPAAIEASTVEWNRNMHRLDRRLAATGTFVAGPAFTLADIVLGLSAYRWTMTPIVRPQLAAVDAWLARLAERAPCRAHCVNGTP